MSDSTMSDSKMSGHVIGLCGGVASGKSTIAGMFGELGAEVLDADAMVHEVYLLADVVGRVGERWAEVVTDGQVDRKALGRIVFEDPDALRALEEIIHPHVRSRIKARLDASVEAGRAVVLDVPLLLESGAYADRCDAIVFVDTPTQQRQDRAAERGWDSGELERRESRQMPLTEKAERSDFTVQNDGDLNAARAQVARIWDAIQQRPTSSLHRRARCNAAPDDTGGVV